MPPPLPLAAATVAAAAQAPRTPRRLKGTPPLVLCWRVYRLGEAGGRRRKTAILTKTKTDLPVLEKIALRSKNPPRPPNNFRMCLMTFPALPCRSETAILRRSLTFLHYAGF